MRKKNKIKSKSKSKIKNIGQEINVSTEIKKQETFFEKIKKGFKVINSISNLIRIYDFLEEHTDSSELL